MMEYSAAEMKVLTWEDFQHILLHDKKNKMSADQCADFFELVFV